MKKLIPILFVIITGCASERMMMNFVDYSVYPDFFITESNSVSFDYKPVGSINFSYTGYKLYEKVAPGTDGIYDSNDDNSIALIHKKALDFVIKSLVDKTKELEGNGIINFSYEPVMTRGIQIGWHIKGMAIKIEN